MELIASVYADWLAIRVILSWGNLNSHLLLHSLETGKALTITTRKFQFLVFLWYISFTDSFSFFFSRFYGSVCVGEQCLVGIQVLAKRILGKKEFPLMDVSFVITLLTCWFWLAAVGNRESFSARYVAWALAYEVRFSTCWTWTRDEIVNLKARALILVALNPGSADLAWQTTWRHVSRCLLNRKMGFHWHFSSVIQP